MTSQSGDAILEARGLAKRYSGLPAVQEINFAIHAGEILGCLGPNGSGKSTTVKMVTGLLEPSRGEVLFRGAGIRQQLAEYKRELGYVPEQPDLYEFLTGWEYLDLVATLRGMKRQRFREKAAALLEGFALYPERNQLIASYSKGMRQRIVLISALLHDPRVLVLDEPLSGLDVASALIVRKVVEMLAEQGKAIFFSSPVLEVVEKLCSHLVLLKRGVVVASGPMQEVQAGFAHAGLENSFMQLTEQVDADRIARNIVSAIRAPVH